MKRKLIVFFILILAVGGVIIIPRLVVIQEINCKSQYGPCDIEIQNQLNQLVGKNYLVVNKEIKKTLKDNPRVEKYSLKFNFPKTLALDLLQTKAVVAFHYEQKYLLVSDRGEIITEVTETDLPTVNVNSNATFSTKEKHLFATKLMQRMFLVYGAKESYVEKEHIYFDLNTGKKIYFPLEGDVDVLLGSLQVVLSRLNSENNYSIIDLRFKNPIIK